RHAPGVSGRQGDTNMKKQRWVLPGALLLLLAFHATAAGEPLLIENVTLLSPELSQPLGNRHVLIREGRIAAVSDRPIPAPANARHLDGTEKYLTPGVFDPHIPVSQAVGLPPGSMDPAIKALEDQFFAQQPRSYLY